MVKTEVKFQDEIQLSNFTNQIISLFLKFNYTNQKF